jgi:hypothetical protein
VASKKTKKTKFVPRVVLGSVALVSVVPAVALIGCGGELSQASAQTDAGGKPDAAAFGVGVGSVAATGFGVADAGWLGVADAMAVGPDAASMGVAATGFDAAGFTVAATGFDDGGTLGVAATGFDAAGFTVADSGFDGSSGDAGGNEDAG